MLKKYENHDAPQLSLTAPTRHQFPPVTFNFFVVVFSLIGNVIDASFKH